MFQSLDGKKSCNIKVQSMYEWQRKFPTGVKFLYFRKKSSHRQEEPTIPDLNRENENLQLFYLLIHLGLDRDCEKLKGTKRLQVQKTNNKEKMFRPYEIFPFVLSLALGVSWHWVLWDVWWKVVWVSCCCALTWTISAIRKLILFFHVPTTALFWEFSEWEGTAFCVLEGQMAP